MKEKGIILTPNVNIEGHGVIADESFIERSDLLAAVLYWDKALFINSDFIYYDISEDQGVPLLIQEGFLKEDVASITQFSGSASDAVVYGINKRISEIFEDNSESWIVNRMNKSIMNKIGLIGPEPDSGTILRLINALPLPSPQRVQDMGKLLKFKEKRSDELTSLRIAIDSIEIDVLKADNRELALREGVNKIDKACHDLIRLHKESRIEFDLGDIKFNFSQSAIKEAIAGYAAACTAVKMFEIPETAALVASIAYGITAVVEVSPSISLRKIDRSDPFIYAADVSIKLCK